MDKQSNRIAELENELSIANKSLQKQKENENYFESKYKTLFNGISDAVFVHPLNKKGFNNFIEVNEIACKYLGYSKEELLNLTPADISLPDEAELRGNKLNREKLLKNKWQIFEATHIKKDGSYIPVEISSRIFEYRNQPVIISLARDITKRIEETKNLELSEKKLRTILSVMDDFVFVLDKENRFESFYASPKKLYLSPEMFLGKKHSEVMPPHVDAKFEAALAEMKVKSIADFEYALLTNGKKRWFSIKLSPLMDGLVYSGVVAVARDITDRKISEEVIKENEAKINSILKSIPTGIGLVINREIQFVNEKFTEVTGYQENEIIGKNARMFYPSDEEYDRVGKYKYDEISKYGKGTIETQIKRKNGEIREVLLSSTPINLNNLEEGVVFSVLDISDRKKAEAKVIETEYKFKQLADNTYDWEYWIDPKGDYIYISPSCERITGYTPEEFISDPKIIIDLIQDDYKEDVLLHYSDENSKNIPLHKIEFPIITKSGEEIWIEHHCSPVFDDEGNYAGRRGNNRDITERKKALEKSINVDLKFKNIFYTSPDAIAITRMEDGVYVDVNDGFAEITGFSRDEVVGKSALDINIWGDSKNREAFIDKLKIENRVNNLKTKLRKKDGSIIDGLVSARTFMLNNDTHIIFVGRDISEIEIIQKRIIENEAKFSSLFHEHSAIKLIIDPETNEILDANLAASNYYGWSIDELKAMRITDINTFSEEKIKKMMKKVESKELHKIEFKHRRADGRISDVEVYSSPIIIDGKVVLYSIIHDISEKKESEKELAKLSLATEQSPVIVVIADIHGNIEYVNPKFTEVTGYSLKEAVGKKPSLLKSGEHSQEFYEKMWDTILAGHEWNGELCNKKKSGEIYWESAKISGIKNSDGIIANFVAVKQDITESREQAKRLRKSEYILNETQSISKVGGWEYKITNERVIWTKEVFKIYGISDGQIPALDERIKYYHKDYREQVLNAFNNCIKTGEKYDVEARFTNAKGEDMWVRTSAKAIFVDDKVYKVVGNIVDITETKRISEELLKNEKMFQLITDNAFDFIWTIDMEMNITYSSSSVERLLGYSQEEITKINANVLYSTEEFKRVQKILVEELAKGVSHKGTEFRIKHLRKDRSEFTAEVKATIIYNGNNEPILIQGYTRDISTQLEAQEKIKKSEERFSRLSSLTYEGIIIHKNGVVIDANLALSKITGYSLEEMIGKNIVELVILERDHPKIYIKMQNAITKPYEVEGITKDGKIIQLEIESRVIDYGTNEENIRVVAIRDVTQRKENELEILKLTNAIKQSPVSIVITNTEGDIEFVNPKFEEVTGYSYEEVLSQNPRVVKSGKQSDEFYKNLWNTIISGNEWRGEFHNKKKNGELFWESALISPVKNNHGKTTNFIAIKEDITEKKKMLEEIIASKEQAEKADKMKSIFLAQMSHEIRTPINALVSMSSLLRYDFEESATEDQMMSFDIIDRAGGRIIRTIDLLLNLSEIQAGTYETNITKFDIFTEVISQNVLENKLLAKKKNIDLKLISNTKATEIVADYYTINQIFVQLIDNAIKYTEEGEVRITISRNEADQLIVEIKDSGIGIDKEYLPNLFEPFSQEEMGYTRKYEGNGIGMALVKTYCALNSAKIEVESQKGIGSTFKVVFNHKKDSRKK